MKLSEDIIGQKFNSWTVIGLADFDKYGRRRVIAQCVCGVTKTGMKSNLRKCKSCFLKSKSLSLGSIHGEWTILSDAGKNKHGQKHFLCRCSCGKESLITQGSLKGNGSTRCEGCQWKKAKLGRIKHGFSHTSTYGSWQNMKRRCNSSSSNEFHRYGGRGIKVCERWDKFKFFLEDMGIKPLGLELDRIDPDGNYEPGNCRWVTSKENKENRRCSAKYRGIYIYVRKAKLCKKCAANVLNLKTIEPVATVRPTFKDFMEDILKDPGVKAEYDKLAPYKRKQKYKREDR